MRFLRPLLPAAAGALVLTGAATAQLPAIGYSHHYHPNSDVVAVAWSGPALFAIPGGGINFASQGDALRRCLGIDQTQGGRNQSAGLAESTMFRIAQGWQGTNTPVQGVIIGLVSVQGASESDTTGDACFSPFFASANNAGGHQVGAAALIGNIAGTANPALANGGAFPTVWAITFQWVGSTTAFQGFGPNTTNGSVVQGGFNNPLLINLIFEVQGPLNGDANSNQYYLGSTTERTGLGNGTPATGTGGTTNGNGAYGSGLFGVDAAQSGAVSASRVFAFGNIGGQPTLVASTPTFPGATIGRVEIGGFTGLQTPGLWSINNGSEGNGGPDWTISSAPVSTADIRLNDHLAGGQINTDKDENGTGTPAAAFDPCVIPVANFGFFVYSVTPALNMPQSPLSWDDLGGLIPAQAGSAIIPVQNTKRQGPQTVPANFDAITAQLLTFSTLTFGTPFNGSNDLFLDSPISGAVSSHNEGLFSNITHGISTWSGGAIPIAGAPSTTSAGLRLGVAAVGVQVSACTGLADVTEVANALTVVFQ